MVELGQLIMGCEIIRYVQALSRWKPGTQTEATKAGFCVDPINLVVGASFLFAMIVKRKKRVEI